MINGSVQQRKTLAVLLASILMDFVGTGIVIPLLPFYAQKFGASAFEVGALMGLFPLMSIMAPTLWGSLSDRIGRRPALLFNIAGTALSFLWLGLANSLGMIFMARIIAGLSSSSIVIAQSYVSDLTATEHRTKALSVLSGAAGVGFVMGPLIGGLLVGPDPANPDFRLPGLVAALFSAVTFGLAWLTLPVLHHRVSSTMSLRQSIPQFLITIKTTFQRPLIATIMSVVFVTTFANMGPQSIFALWCNQIFGWGPKQLGYCLIYYCLAIAIIQLTITGRLAQRLGESTLLLVGVVMGTLGVILIPLSTTVPQFLGAIFFGICAVSLGNPAMASLLSHLSAAKQQGKTLGLMQSVVGLGGFLGSIVAGLAFGIGPNWPFYVSTVLMIGALFWSWLNLSKTKVLAVKRDRRQQKLIYLFDMLDHDGSGTLELKDFQQAATALAELRGWQSDTSQYEVLQASFIGLGELLQELADQDSNQKIDQEEWLRCLSDRVDYDFANFFLKIIDINQDSEVAFEELKLFYQAYNIQINKLEDIFHTLDLNQDGSISQDEFETLFTQFLYSDDIQAPGNWILGASLPTKL